MHTRKRYANGYLKYQIPTLKHLKKYLEQCTINHYITINKIIKIADILQTMSFHFFNEFLENNSDYRRVRLIVFYLACFN